MKKRNLNPKEQLANYDIKYQLKNHRPCSKFENEQFAENVKLGIPLPDHVWENYQDGKFTGKYSKLSDSGLNEEEKTRFLMYQQMDILNGIRGILIFFAVVLALNLIGSFLLGFLGAIAS